MEQLREGEGGTEAAEKLGDICDEIRNAPANSAEKWQDIERQLEDLESRKVDKRQALI